MTTELKKCPICEKELKLVPGRTDAYECISQDCPSREFDFDH